jgi:cell division septation protein DedD
MTQFLTVKEAARSTGKSPSSIRRIIYPILESPDHPDRPHIQPTVEEVQQFRIKGENFAWRISDDLLQREVPPESVSEKGNDRPGARSLHDSDAELLSMLRGELDIKNQQITQQAAMLATQMKLIEGLSERLREGNILIGSLHQQLVLTDGSSRAKSKPVEADMKSSTAEKPATKTPTKAVSKPMKPKRGFFGRMFHGR